MSLTASTSGCPGRSSGDRCFEALEDANRGLDPRSVECRVGPKAPATASTASPTTPWAAT